MNTQQMHTSLLLVIVVLATSYSQAQNNRRGSNNAEWKNFDVMTNYLCRGSGKWTGKNKNHDPNNPRSARAFGLWFERPLPNLVILKIVAYQQDTVMLSSQGIFAWNPEQQQFIHSTVDRGNGFSTGVTTFPNDTTFISTMTIYRPNGNQYAHKDENFVVSENVHRNTSFGKDENGNWVARGYWVWVRDSL